MKKGVVISDSGPIFSLAIIDKLEILDALFDRVYIPNAVWEEITTDKTTEHYQRIAEYFAGKVQAIKGFNDLDVVVGVFTNHIPGLRGNQRESRFRHDQVVGENTNDDGGSLC